MFSKTSSLVAIIVLLTIVASEGRRQRRNLFTSHEARFPRRRLITWKRVPDEPFLNSYRGVDMTMDERDQSVGGFGRKAACIGAACMMMFNKGAMPPKQYNGYNNPIAPIHRGVDMMMDERDQSVGGFGRKAACIGAACMMMFNKGAMPPKQYNGYNNPIAPIHRGVDMMMDERDQSVGGFGRKAACIGAACMMMFNKGAMPPKQYNGYNNPIAPIHRGVDMMMDERDQSVGSDALGCYLFPQAPKCRGWDMLDDEDDTGVHSVGWRAKAVQFTTQ
eukprot:g7621.t1